MARKNQVTLTFAGDSNKLERTFGQVGRAARGMEKEVKRANDDIERGFLSAGVSSAKNFAESLTTGFRNLKGPLIAVALAGIVTAAPAVGALAAGGLVAAFGLGLAGLALAVTRNSPKVAASVERLKTEVTSRIKKIAKPFEDVWLLIVSDARAAFNKFAPALESAFAKLAPITSMLSDTLFRALEKLAPVINPVVDAFEAIAITLKPAIPAMIGGMADGITEIADSVKKNPTALADFFKGLGTLTKDALKLVAALNDMNGKLEDVTGGVSAVDVVIGIVRGPILLLTGSVKGLTVFLGFLRSAWDKIKSIFSKRHTASITGNGSGFFSVIRSVQATAGRWARSIFRAGVSANGGGVGTVVSWAYRVGGGWARSTFKAVLGAIEGVSAVYNYVNRLGNSWAGRVFKATFGATSLVGNLLGRASGGPVNAGQSYMVGERGPEIVTMGGNGFVTPNHRLPSGGGTTVIEIRSGGSRLDDLLVEMLRNSIRAKGGNVQVVLGPR